MVRDERTGRPLMRIPSPAAVLRQPGLLLAPRPRRSLLAAAVAAALTPLPLVGTLGYESSLVLAPLLALLGTGCGLEIATQARASGEADPLRVIGHLATRTAEPWMASVLVLVVGMLWQPNCDPLAGVGFSALGPLAAAYCGAVGGLWAATLTQRPARAWCLALALPLLSTTLAIVALLRGPAVFAFDPYWGWFAGPIYDEDVGVDGRYLAFRAYNGLALAAALGAWVAAVQPGTLRLGRPRGRGRHVAAAAAGLGALGAAILGARGPALGFRSDRDALHEALPLEHSTEHFILHFAPRSATARELAAIAGEHEFAWERLATTLGAAPEPPIHVYLFPTPEAKRAWTGAGRVEVALPWRGELYLDERPFPAPSLHHELAHAFEAAIGDPIFGLSLAGGIVPRIALLEGVATALAPASLDGLDLHDQAAVLDRLGKRPSLEAILGAGFWSAAPRHAYTAAGSFVAWLLETHDGRAIAALYRKGGDFSRVFGAELPALESAWVDFLRARSVDEVAVAVFAERFRRPSIFARPCAHRVARVAERAERALLRGDGSGAIAELRELCALEPERPDHRLGLVDALARAGRLEEAARELASLDEANLPTAALRAAVLQREGDLALVGGDREAAREAFGRALEEPLGDDEGRVLRLKYLGADDAALAPEVTRYFAPWSDDEGGSVRALQRLHHAVRIRDTPGWDALGNYLLGLQLLSIQDHEPAVAALERSLSPGPGSHALPQPDFLRAAQERLLGAYVATGRFGRARALHAQMAAGPSLRAGDLRDLELWRERIEWFAARASGLDLTAPK